MKTLLNTVCLSIVVLLVTMGCSTLTDRKNKSFVEGISKTDKPYHVVYLCRPNQINKFAESQGIYINEEPAFDLWMGNQYRIKLPTKYRSLKLMIPFQNPLGEIFQLGKRNKISFNVPDNNEISFYIISTRRITSLIGVIVISQFGGVIEGEYSVFEVNKKSFDSQCGKEKIIQYHHKTLS